MEMQLLYIFQEEYNLKEREGKGREGRREGKGKKGKEDLIFNTGRYHQDLRY